MTDESARSSAELRLFIALELPADVQTVLREARDRLARQPLAVRWVDVEGAHLTLKFLGATPATRVPVIREALETAAGRHAPFMLGTAGLGVFPKAADTRVVWLGVEGALDKLRALQMDVERLVAPLGYPTEKRPFSPHLTIGRTVKHATRGDAARIGAAVMSASFDRRAEWQVTGISLMRSELRPGGARYTAEAHIKLDTPGTAAIITARDDVNPASNV